MKSSQKISCVRQTWGILHLILHVCNVVIIKSTSIVRQLFPAGMSRVYTIAVIC